MESTAQRDAAVAARNERRRESHPGAWRIAQALRLARGDSVVTDRVWSDAVYLANNVTSPAR